MAAPRWILPTPSSNPLSTPTAMPVAFRGALALAVASILLAPQTATAAGLRETRPNLVGGEILGRGVVATVNYERFFTNHFGLGGGAMAIATSDGQMGIMPLYASYLSGDRHSLYLSAGGALFGGGGSIKDYQSLWILQGSAGYHFQSVRGFFVRPIVTIFHGTEGNTDSLVWPGVTIGKSF